ncbi:hypothetical protein [Roseibacillus ishigakijimensis]|uniref:CorA-like Mg2+ transporter protein n=1 Tax=Roseibacillus ishigakijimensis TaxID=454146 RepID=A0A934VNQ8_9BACT|nr:hypothetical protein [Roseibacillus ishigakijimensis]MBK1835577.1 hypothetical protein [Roseibacillus ishigakijimensis]
MTKTRREYVPKNWELPAAIWNRLGPEPGRQRLMDEEEHLLLIVHQVPQAADDEKRTAALFWRQPEGAWKSTPEPGGLTALDELLKSYRETIHGLDQAVESAAEPQDYFRIMQEIQPVLRAARLNRLVAFFFPFATLVAFFSMGDVAAIYAAGSSWLVALAGMIFGALVWALVTRGK